MLSLEHLKYYCRTCLIKFETIGDSGDSQKFVLIKKLPEVELLMRICVRRGADIESDDTLDVHIPNICSLCANKWKSFAEHYQEAIKSDEQLRKLLEKNLQRDVADGVETDDKFNEMFLELQTLNNNCGVEKYETTSPFYQESQSSIATHGPPAAEEFNNLLEDGQQDCDVSDLLLQNDNSNLESCITIEGQTFHTAKRARPAKCKNLTLNLKESAVNKIRRKYKTRKVIKDTQDMMPDNDTTPQYSNDNADKRLRYHCELCKRYFYEIHKYEGHVKKVHEGIPKPFKCQYCDKTYTAHAILIHHISENHSGKSRDVNKCQECNKTFKTSKTLKMHIHSIHLKGQKEKSYKMPSTGGNNKLFTQTICDQCGFMAAHQYSLAQHIKNKHTETQELICEHCPKVFKSQYSLKYHKLSNHNPMNIKPFHCSECQMTFTRRTLLNLHKRTHLKYTERIKCDFEGCDVRFVKHGDKNHHMRLVHLKVKQLICDFCGEAFGAMQTLRHHRYIHTGKKPYKCNVCGQGFRQRTAMKNHCKTHFGKEKDDKANETLYINNLEETNVNLDNK